MNPKRKQRLYYPGFSIWIGCGRRVGDVRAKSKHQFIFTPTQIAKGDAPVAQMIVVGWLPTGLSTVIHRA